MNATFLSPRGHGAIIKVCGLTRPEDACLAWELGAAALGFIFHPPSPRHLQVEVARDLRRALPQDACCVGVFVDRSPAEIREVVDAVGLQAVQLHGHEAMGAMGALGLPIIKVVRVADEAGIATHPADLVLVDAALPGIPGGTGLKADWSLAARIAAVRPLLLAGGISPENAHEALQVVKPFALDVNSGVESAPGIKSHTKLRALFQHVPP